MCVSLVFALLVGLQMASYLVEATQPVDGEVIFDSSYLKEVEMPVSCAGQSYCFDKGDDYPDGKIENLVKSMTEFEKAIRVSWAIFHPDKIMDPAWWPWEKEMENSAPRINIDNRNGDTYDEPDCLFNYTESPIFYITDITNRVRVVVQSPKKFQQIYSVRWCLEEGRITSSAHFLANSKLLEKFRIECITTTIDVNFFVLSEDETEIDIATVKGGIPVCCKCRYSAE